MRILIADGLPERARARLASEGAEVHSDSALKERSLEAALLAFQPDVLVVRSTRVEAAHIDASSSLELVVRAGAGVNTIDLAACGGRGVFVANCPGRNAVAVAELTMGLLLCLDRQIPDNVAELRAGRWDKKRFGAARGLAGRTLGLLGLGSIGKEVAIRALAMDMRVLAWSRSLDGKSASAAGIERRDTPEAVAAEADALSVHLALTPETRGLVGASVFAALRPGALFINTARADVVDPTALHHAVEEQGIRAGLDVFHSEPSAKQGAIDDPLATHPGVYGTHHIAASTEQAQQAVADEVCRIIETYRATGTVPNCVNLARRTSADHLLVVRHQDRVGVLAAILVALREAHLNVQEMENTIFAGGGAAIARIQVHGSVDEALRLRLADLPDVLAVTALAIRA